MQSHGSNQWGPHKVVYTSTAPQKMWDPSVSEKYLQQHQTAKHQTPSSTITKLSISSFCLFNVFFRSTKKISRNLINLNKHSYEDILWVNIYSFITNQLDIPIVPELLFAPRFHEFSPGARGTRALEDAPCLLVELQMENVGKITDKNHKTQP